MTSTNLIDCCPPELLVPEQKANFITWLRKHRLPDNVALKHLTHWRKAVGCDITTADRLRLLR